MHAMVFRASARNRKLIRQKYRGMPRALPKFASLRFDPARPFAHPVTLAHLRQLALCGFIGLQRIPREAIAR
jgi:hypothetical protein